MEDERFMRRAIELARRGEGFTNPNPMVGAVVVKNGEIIGEGYHEYFGGLHAERNALAACTGAAKGATLYVTLEPCCHDGKTPPCTSIIIESGIKKVVIGSRDPNPKVAGKGVSILKEHDIEVTEDFLRGECDRLNPVFFHYITTGRPYVIMKYAMTLDGKIATRTGASKWITGDKARCHAHRLRNRYASILVGIGTVLADDPMLDCRIEGGRNPLRVICDSSLRISPKSRLCRSAVKIPTVIACAHLDSADREKKARLKSLGLKILELPGADGQVDLKKLLEWLGSQGIDSVLIEGGGEIHYSALRTGAVNHVCAYVAPKLFGGREARSPVGGLGACTPADGTMLENMQLTRLGEDLLLEYDVLGGGEDVHRNH